MFQNQTNWIPLANKDPTFSAYKTIYVGFDHYFSTKPTLSIFMIFHVPCYPSVAQNFHITSQACWTFQRLPMCLCICPRWKEIPIPHLFTWRCWKRSMRKFDNPEGDDKNRKTSHLFNWPNLGGWHLHVATQYEGTISVLMLVAQSFLNHTMSWSTVLQTNHAQNYHHISNK